MQEGESPHDNKKLNMPEEIKIFVHKGESSSSVSANPATETNGSQMQNFSSDHKDKLHFLSSAKDSKYAINHKSSGSVPGKSSSMQRSD